MKRCVLTALVFIAGLSLFGATQETQIKLQTVFEKTFPDTIVDVIFDTATVSLSEAKAMGWKTDLFSAEEKGKGKVSVPYPRVIFVGTPTSPIKGKVKEIRFINKNGKVMNDIQLKSNEDVIKSKNGHYILIRKRVTEDDPYSEWRIYTSDGENVLEKERVYRIFPTDISDEGYVVGVEYPVFSGGPFGDGIIYNAKGIQIAKINNPLKIDEGWAVAKFSERGIIFGFSDTYTKSVIKLVKKNGELLWEKEIPLGSYFLLRSDKNVGIVIIFQDNNIKPYQTYVYCIGWDGEIRWKTPLEIGGIMDIRIDSSKKKVFITSCAGYLWVINAESGNILWRYREEWAPDIYAQKWPQNTPRFREISFLSNSVVIVKGSPKKENSFSTLFLFDVSKKKLLNKVEFNKQIYLKVYRKEVYLVNPFRKTLQGINVLKRGGE